MPDPDPRRMLRDWPWGLALAVGTGLRAWGLSEQVPVDDEWHALHRVVDASYAQVALSFGFVDHCIPLTLLYKLAADTLGLGDALLRLPSLLAGVALLVVAPALAGDLVGRRGRALYAWLLALAPMLLLYSRYVRPYAVALLLCVVALHAIARWWRSGEARDAVAYGVAGALAAWTLLPTLPFVLGPIAVALVAPPLPGGRDARDRLRRVALPAGALALCALPLLGPPLLHDPAVVLGKLGATGLPEPRALRTAAVFLLGTRSLLLGLALVLLGVAGARILWRRDPAFGRAALGATAALALGVLVSGLAYAWLGFVLARYLLPVLPLGLLAVSAAVERGAERLGRPRAAALAGAVLGAGMLATGGAFAALAETRAWFPSRYVTRVEGRVPLPARVPSFYRALGERSGPRLLLVEAPWYYSLWNNLLPAYERIHGQRTRIGMTTGLCSPRHWGEYPPGRGVDLDAFVHLASPEALRRAGADYVVFHRDLAGEMETVIDPVDVRATGQPDVRGCAAAYAELGWPVAYRDEDLLVFAVPREGRGTGSQAP